MREKIILRDNWNYFVGDQEYKTDIWLRFLTPISNFVYEKYVAASCQYSQRVCFCVILAFNLFHMNSHSGYISQLFWTFVFFGLAVLSTLD